MPTNIRPSYYLIGQAHVDNKSVLGEDTTKSRELKNLAARIEVCGLFNHKWGSYTYPFSVFF